MQFSLVCSYEYKRTCGICIYLQACVWKYFMRAPGASKQQNMSTRKEMYAFNVVKYYAFACRWCC